MAIPGVSEVLDFIGLGTPDQPASPDYTAAAEATAAGNLEMAGYTTDVNRPDQYTPFGSTTWTQGTDIDQAGFDAALAAYDPNTGAPTRADYTTTEEFDDNDITGYRNIFDQAGFDAATAAYSPTAPTIGDYTTTNNDWTQTTTMSPEQRAIFESQQAGDLFSSDLGNTALQNASGMFSTPYQTGLDPLSSYDDQRAGIIESLMARVDTDVGRDRETKKSQLIAQGIPENSPAFDTEMERFDRRLTDANQQAELGATDIISKMLADQNKTRNQIMSEDLTERQTPLNEWAALTGGTSVQNPNMPGFSQQQQILGPDYMGATTAEGAWDLAGWNADVAGNNAIVSGLFDLGAAGISR